MFAFHAWALLAGGPGSAAPGTGANLAANGLLGVQLFFVLSGFLLAMPWMRAASGCQAPPAIGRFYRRRVLRIFPAYLLHLAVLFGVVLPLLYGGFAILGSELGRWNLTAHAGLLHFLHPGSAGSLGLNMALWSLSIEAQFYLLLPLLAPLFTGRRVLFALPAAMAFSLAWKTWAPSLVAPWLWDTVPPDLLVYFDPVTGTPMSYPPGALAIFVERQLPGELIAFALGMAAANAAARLPIAQAAPALPRRCVTSLVRDTGVLILMLAWALLLAWVPLQEVMFGSPWRLIGMPAFLISVALLVFVAHLGSGAGVDGNSLLCRVLGNPVFAGIGLVSYSLFLWHEPILRLVRAGWIGVPGVATPALLITIGLGVALVVALLSFLVAERPGLR